MQKELEDLPEVTAKASQRLDEEARFTSEVILSYQTGTISNDAGRQKLLLKIQV